MTHNWVTGEVITAALLNALQGTADGAAVVADIPTAGTVTGDALRAAYVPFWEAAETVTTGTVRVDATGHLITANSNRTTRATYDATEQAAWTATGATVSDATTGTKGIVQLAGDLGGTAAAPIVAKINGGTPATVATTGAYGDLSGKPSIPTVPYLNAADYGFLTSATAATNNTAFASAVTAARTAGKALYIPGQGLGTPYLVSAPLDLTAGAIKVFGDPGQTQINNTLNTSALIKCGGSLGYLADINVQHATTLDANTGNGIEVNNVDSWTFERVQVYSCGWGFKQTGGSFFTNYLQGMNIKRFWSGAIYLTGGTGSQWNNTYVNNSNGTTGAVCADSIVRLEQLDESVFNQLNIEWCVPNNQTLLVNGSRTCVFNSLHIEQVNLTIFQQQMIRSFGDSRLIVNGLTVKFCDVAPAGSQGGGRGLLGTGGGGSIDVRGLTAEANSNTAAQAAQLAIGDSTAGTSLRVATIANDVFTTASTGANLRQVGDPVFVTKAGALTTTDLPLSGMIGIDTTNSKFYVNVAGTVKGVTVA